MPIDVVVRSADTWTDTWLILTWLLTGEYIFAGLGIAIIAVSTFLRLRFITISQSALAYLSGEASDEDSCCLSTAILLQLDAFYLAAYYKVMGPRSHRDPEAVGSPNRLSWLRHRIQKAKRLEVLTKTCPMLFVQVYGFFSIGSQIAGTASLIASSLNAAFQLGGMMCSQQTSIPMRAMCALYILSGLFLKAAAVAWFSLAFGWLALAVCIPTFVLTFVIKVVGLDVHIDTEPAPGGGTQVNVSLSLFASDKDSNPFTRALAICFVPCFPSREPFAFVVTTMAELLMLCTSLQAFNTSASSASILHFQVYFELMAIAFPSAKALACLVIIYKQLGQDRAVVPSGVATNNVGARRTGTTHHYQTADNDMFPARPEDKVLNNKEDDTVGTYWWFTQQRSGICGPCCMRSVAIG
jgi:hypothetical protein